MLFLALFATAIAGEEALASAQEATAEVSCEASTEFGALEQRLQRSAEAAGYKQSAAKDGTVRASADMRVPLKLGAGQEHRIFVLSDGELKSAFVTPDGSEFPLSDLTGPELGGLKGMLGGIAGLPEPLDFTVRVSTSSSDPHKVRVLHFVK